MGEPEPCCCIESSRIHAKRIRTEEGLRRHTIAVLVEPQNVLVPVRIFRRGLALIEFRALALYFTGGQVGGHDAGFSVLRAHRLESGSRRARVLRMDEAPVVRQGKSCLNPSTRLTRVLTNERAPKDRGDDEYASARCELARLSGYADLASPAGTLSPTRKTNGDFLTHQSN